MTLQEALEKLSKETGLSQETIEALGKEAIDKGASCAEALRMIAKSLGVEIDVPNDLQFEIEEPEPEEQEIIEPPKPEHLKTILRIGIWCVWQVYHYSGFRWIWEHLNPRKASQRRRLEESDERPATAFPLWIIGIYIALFGLASNRYESRVDRYEIRVNALVALLANDKVRPVACSQIAEIQQTKIPVKPKLFNPVLTYRSFTTDVPYNEGIQLLISAIESCKFNLNEAILSRVNLSRAIMPSANLNRAKLYKVNLNKANLNKSSLNKASLNDASLIEAHLSNAQLQGVNLDGAQMHFSELDGANLSNSSLIDTNFCGANLFLADLHNADLGNDLAFIPLMEFLESPINLPGANLTGANLTGANLCFIKNWQHENWFETNIYGVENAPEGFREWVLAYGGLEETPQEWYVRQMKIFIQNRSGD